MNKKSPLKYVLISFLLGLTVGCIQLPEHARPRLLAPDRDDPAIREGFSYRQLTVADFRAKSLPEDYRQFNHKIGAQSCISIRASRDSKIKTIQSYYQNMLFCSGTIAQLKLEAVFDPDCSWWNPEIAPSREEYVLQHEQIHFALAELAARRLTKEVKHEVKSTLAIGNDCGEVEKELIGKLKSMGKKAMEANIEEHTDFDKDTSMFYDPSVQKRWLEDVKVRLAE